VNPSNELPQEANFQLKQLSQLEMMRLFAKLEQLKYQSKDYTDIEDSFVLNSYGDLGTTMFKKGMEYAMSNIYSTAQVAEKLGITDGLVLKLAHKMGLGKKLSPQVWVFLPADVDRLELRNKTAGRPERKI